MKKISLMLLMLVLILSCSNDDETTRNQLSGQWRLVSANLLNFDSEETIDYSGDNIIYNFKNNGKLIVTGNNEIAHSTGEFYYKIKKNLRVDNPDIKQENGLYIYIDNTPWALIMTDETMTMSISYIDGPTLNFARK